MDESLIKEIRYLSRLIENHKKRMMSEKSGRIEKGNTIQNINRTKMDKHTNLVHKSQQLCKSSNDNPISTNVYINPNFKRQSLAIHINPKLHMKPLVHVNPKMMRNVVHSNGNNRCNSESISDKSHSTNTVKVKENLVQKSVYVNPKLMKTLSSIITSKPLEQKTEEKDLSVQSIPYPITSKLKFLKSTNSPKFVQNPRKSSNSGILILSRRKLVRVRKGCRKSLNSEQVEVCKIKKSSHAITKHVKLTPQKIVRARIINGLQVSINKDLGVIKSPNLGKVKINKYRIDRTIPKVSNIKGQSNLIKKKTVNEKMELITIGGVVYKSTKNHLVRRSYGVKRKRAASLKTDKFIVATNGKKLCRIRPTKETGNNSSFPKATNGRPIPNVLQKVNYKTNISNKVKQKSIQILRNKMQKNNQPCLIFQKFGYCLSHEKGVCVKRHDKKQVSLCKMFLQGNCLLDKCPLSHDVCPEKMPTCKYFLEGCCTRDSCPYRHIKVSSSTPICIDFLQGYCAKGSECKQRHENLCPEFEKRKSCSKGKRCPYPHKTQTSPKRKRDTKRKYDESNDRLIAPVAKETSSPIGENKLRYYEQQRDVLDKSLEKKTASILRKKINLMKNVESLNDSDRKSVELLDDDDTSRREDNDSINSDSKVLKRPPIGILPAYIPIG